MSTEQLGWRQWKVSAYTGKNRNIKLGSSYVLADNEREAMQIGRRALRLIGVRGSFQVSATQYFPWKDLAFAGFISQVAGSPAKE